MEKKQVNINSDCNIHLEILIKLKNSEKITSCFKLVIDT